MEDIWNYVQPVLSNNTWLVISIIACVFGLVKKVIKLAIIAGIILCIWLVATAVGIAPALPM